jgi:hypothetical protein
MRVSAARPEPTARPREASRLARYERLTEPAVRGLVLAAAVALFLQAAATVDLVYTVRPSFVLMSVAVVLGLPFAVAGWRRTPPWIMWPAAGLLVAYLTALLLGRAETIGLARAGSHRDLAYIGDLAVGMGAFGLVIALWADGRRMWQLLGAVAISGAAAAVYAVYQWPAQIFGWPFDDVVNVPDSNGVTTGASQGAGVFGHERVRGTFLEPHLLGAFLASLLPAALALPRPLLGVGFCLASWRSCSLRCCSRAPYRRGRSC